MNYIGNSKKAWASGIVDTVIYNADAVGVYNILRKYHAVSGKEIDMPVTGLSSTKTIKVAV